MFGVGWLDCHIGVGSNVVCSTIMGNARASTRGMDNRTVPRFFVSSCLEDINKNNNTIMNKKIKAILLGIVLMHGNVAAFSQDDVIILRDGTEMPAKIIQVDSKKVTYREDDSKRSPLKYKILGDVYMVRFEKRGNVYITADGKRITGENEKWDKSTNRIYLVSGREILANSLKVTEDQILYTEKTQSKSVFKKVESQQFSVKRSEVFMIAYSDGTRDIITDLSPKWKTSQEMVDETAETAKQPESKEDEKQVIFHNVKKGDTLAAIAKRYGVEAGDIIGWNDLPKNTKPAARLRPEMQLMIYVEKSN